MGALQPSFAELGTPLYDTTFVVVDLETTGLSPTRDRVTEIGAVKSRGGTVLGELHALVHPGRSIPPAITAVTGITDAMVRGCPPIEAVLPTFLEFLGDGVLVAHNAGFDTGFLNAALGAHGYPQLDNIVVDTARLARRLLRDEVRDCRLQTLAKHLKARTFPEHRALTDARATLDVLHGMLERAGSLGATTLEDLRDYARSTSDPAFRKIDLVRDAPSAPGVYRFRDDRGEVLYVGKATDLRTRLRRYFGQDRRRRIADLVRETAAVSWRTVPTELEASVREVRAIHAHRPRYNRRSRNPERGVYVKLTTGRFPRLSIVTQVRDDGALYVGPVASRKSAEALCDAVHDVLPLRPCTMRIRVAQDHPACVLKDLGRCGAPCDGSQSETDYLAIVEDFRAAVTGDAETLLRPLRDQMHGRAEADRFERAALLRGRLHHLAAALDTSRRTQNLLRCDRIVAARPSGGRFEVAIIEHGRLVTTHLVDDLAAADGIADGLPPPEAIPGPPAPLPTREQVEEVRLVADWLGRDHVRAVRIDGTYAAAVAGGRVLADTVQERRRLSRQLRRDRQTLTGAKVRRRTSDGGGAGRQTGPNGQTRSNQDDQASGTSTIPAGAVPRHSARAR